MSNETTTQQDWHCPTWCPTTDEQHAAVSEMFDNSAGGASHWLTTFDAAGVDLPPVAAVVETDPDGQRKELVFVGAYEAPPHLAREFALAVLRAADLTEMAPAGH